MPESSRGSQTYMAFGLLFTLIAVVALIALVLSQSSADNVSETAYVTNVNPSISNLTIATSSYGGAASTLTLTPSTTTTFFVHGTGTDTNGCGQIDDADGNGTTASKWEGKFYRTSVSGAETCTANNLNCYTITTEDTDLSGNGNACTDATGGSDSSLAFQFDIPVQFYADATVAASLPDYASTNWTAWVKVYDDQGGTGTATATTEVDTLKAIGLEASSETYPSTAFGAQSAEQTINVYNRGNYDDLDLSVSQSAVWSCTIGTIPIANLKHSVTSGGAQTDMSATPANLNLNIDKSITGVDTSSTGTFYTKLTIPASGVAGTCTSTLVVGATQ
jgi:hypothetical protein